MKDNYDRGIIKWQPFNSLFNAGVIIQDINKEKSKEKCPILSEDQLENIEDTIKNAYILKQNVDIKYYYDGNIIEKLGKINYLDIQNKNICLSNKIIYFKQILKITII